MTILELTEEAIIEQLKQHRLISRAPLAELEWLARHGEMRRYEAGEFLVRTGMRFEDGGIGLSLFLSGTTSILVDRGLGPRKIMTLHAGDISGVLPFSRATASAADGLVEEPVVLLSVAPDQFPALIRECHAVIEICVHVMLDRARIFTSSDWQHEKIMALGKLAAGLAHELNNPASAAARSARLLTRSVAEAERAADAIVGAQLNEAQLGSIVRVRNACQATELRNATSPVERADREDAIAKWLVAHGADTSAVAALAETALTIQELDALASTIPGSALDAALDWVAAGCELHQLASEIQRAASRIYDLIAAVKGFTQLDRAHLPEPTDVEPGLRDTLRVLGSKVNARNAIVTIDVPHGIPAVQARASDLNQVWANVIDNALDAVSPSGRVQVTAHQFARYVVVRVIDDGPGIPADIMHRIYDPFFTTKEPGKGSGLGLDIARRIIRDHNGDIEAESRPGRTEFRISLPVAQDGSDGRMAAIYQAV